MKPLLVIDVVGLTPRLVGEDTPNLSALAQDGFLAELTPVLPAVTCAAQATMLTGLLPREHGIVGNGWYFRDLAEVWFWRQSNRLVSGPRVWEEARARHPGLSSAKLFWWYNMYSSADLSVTPRPVYPADGRKILDIYSSPAELREEVTRELGPFPFLHFWGPGADIRSTRWIGRCAEHVLRARRPDLCLVYLPHLDYDFQRFGPDFEGRERALRDVDEVTGRLIRLARELGHEVLVVSEYGITVATGSVSPNRLLRAEGWLEVRSTPVGEMLDPGASRAFAVCDHQVAHVYVRDPSDVPSVARLLESVDGVDQVLDRDGQRAVGLDHERSGELVCVADADRWFDYYYWLDEARAPDFATTVDIHRKPGYDPAELFLDPALRFPRLRIARRLLQKRLGFRYLMDVIPRDPSLVRGTHGRLPGRPEDGPVAICGSAAHRTSRLAMTDVAALILDVMLGGGS